MKANYFLIAIILIFISGVSYSHAGGKDWHTPIELFNKLIAESMPDLENTLKFTKTTSKKRIDFCPDNTCVSFVAPSSTPDELLMDFSYLYLFYRSNYTYLKMTVTKAPPFSESGNIIIPDIFDKYKGQCKSKTEQENATCILKKMAKEENITIYSVRFDEDEQNETKVDL